MDSPRHTSIALRQVALLSVVLSASGFQFGEGVVCHVDEAGQATTRQVTASDRDRLLGGPGSYPGPCAVYGPAALIGDVMVQAFAQVAEDGRPFALGIRLPHAAFATLPSEAADGYRCLDLNGDDEIDVAAECVGGHERVLFLPGAWEDGVASPFRWALFNWNPLGHGPPGVWDVPHFDFHFFIQSLADRSRIRIGRCAMLVDCDDLDAGTRPVPAEHLPGGYEDRGVVEFGMGNHLIDPASFGSPSRPATHTLIYGAWAGRVSFLEPMVTLDFLDAVRLGDEPGGCYPIPQPAAVAEAGYYPTEYCIRHRRQGGAFLVSLEGFRWRSTGEGPP